MKKIVLFFVAAMATLFVGCTQDNVHMPESEIIYVGDTATTDFPKTISWEGTLTSGVPQFGGFTPVPSPNRLRLTDRTDASAGYATLTLEAFDITTPMGMSFSIGEMRIDSVQYATYPGGNGMFVRDDFSVQAGKYLTKGSLKGTFTAGGTVSMTMTYKPGSMPFEVVSEFEGVKE